MPPTRRLVLAAAAAAALPRTAHAAIPESWADTARRRNVPVLLRLPPGNQAAPAPAVVVSHGLGGSRHGLAYLGTALAEAGFVAIHVQHVGTDTAIWQGAANPRASMAAAVLDPRRAADRLADIAFVLDALPRQPSLRGRVDPARIAIAGHSYGAWTVTHMLGQRLPGGDVLEQRLGLTLPDPRLSAGIALSPVPPIAIAPAEAYDRIQAPILHVTGTRDGGTLESASPEDRLIPYRNSTAPAVLVVMRGAGHAAFAGEEAAGPHWNNPAYHGRTARLAILFLRAVLLRDAAAEALLRRGAGLAEGDRLENRGALS
jgi:predicted dienelactone hydrolase